MAITDQAQEVYETVTDSIASIVDPLTEQYNKIKESIENIEHIDLQKLSEEEKKELQEKKEKSLQDLANLQKKIDEEVSKLSTTVMSEDLKNQMETALESLKKEVNTTKEKASSFLKSGWEKFTGGVADAWKKSTGWIEKQWDSVFVRVGVIGGAVIGAGYGVKKLWDWMVGKDKWDNVDEADIRLFLLEKEGISSHDSQGKKVLIEEAEKRKYQPKHVRKWAKEKEKRADEKTNSGGSAKKPWYKTFWGWVKAGAIGVGGYLGINRLVNQFKETPNAGSSFENAIDAIIRLKANEKLRFERYQALGEQVDGTYRKIMDKEIKSEGEGPLNTSIADGYKKYVDEKDIADFKATIPYCLDGQFGTVKNLLGSERQYFLYKNGKDIKEYENIILSWLGVAKIPLLSGLLGLKSFKPYTQKIKEGADVTEVIKEWLNGSGQNRIDELDWFFRQYAKVLRYLQDRRLSLQEKIAQKNFTVVEGGPETWQEAIQDRKWMEDHVYNDQDYKDFMAGNIDNAIKVIQDDKYNILNDTLSQRTEEDVKDCNDERAKILNEKDGEDALQRLGKGIESGSLTEEQKQEGVIICENVMDDLEDTFKEDVSYILFKAVGVAFNTDDHNFKEFWEESGLKSLEHDIIVKLEDFQSKFRDGTITVEEAKNCKLLINQYFIARKEAILGGSAIQDMKSEGSNGSVRGMEALKAVYGSFVRTLEKTCEDVQDGNYLSAWLWATPSLMIVSGVATKVGRSGSSFGHALAKLLGFVSGINAGHGLGVVITQVPRSSYRAARVLSKIPRGWGENLVLWSRYNTAKGAYILLDDVFSGHITGQVTNTISNKGCAKWDDFKKGNLSELIQKLANLKSTEASDNLIRLLENSSQIRFLENESIRKLFVSEIEKKIDSRNIHSYRKWKVEETNLKNGSPLMDKINGFTKPAKEGGVFHKLSKPQQKLVLKLLKEGDFDAKALENIMDEKIIITKLIGLDNTNRRQTARLLLDKAKNPEGMKIFSNITERNKIITPILNDRILKQTVRLLDTDIAKIQRLYPNSSKYNTMVRELRAMQSSLGTMNIDEVKGFTYLYELSGGFQEWSKIMEKFMVNGIYDGYKFKSFMLAITKQNDANDMKRIFGVYGFFEAELKNLTFYKKLTTLSDFSKLKAITKIEGILKFAKIVSTVL